MNSDQDRLKSLVKASFIAIFIDLFLIGLKYMLAKFTGSAVLLADAWHSGGDFAVSFSVLLSLIFNHKFKQNIWARNAEGLVALLIAGILLFGSINVIIGAFRNEVERFLLEPGIPLVIAIFGISIACAISFEMFRYKERIGEKFSSIAFKAESDHTRSDYFTSFGVLLTLVLGYFSIHVERVMTFLVGLMVFRIGFKLLLKSLNYFNIPIEAGVNLLKNIIPDRYEKPIKDVAHNIIKLYTDFKNIISQLFFVREEWIIRRKKAIVISVFVFCTLLYFGTGFYSNLP